MNKVRDYSAKTIEAFIKYMDGYYSNQNDKIKHFWNQVFHYLNLFTKDEDKINGDPEKYIRSLTERRGETERKIKDAWVAVGNVEKEYKYKYDEVGSLCGAYSDIVSKVAGTININSFSDPVSFGALLNKCSDEYFKLIETKINKIIKKPAHQLTDGDIEILAYVALNTTNEELKEKIYNTFYHDTTDKHITYVNGTPDDPYCRYYDRDDDAWKKFMQCEEAYFQEYYEKYLDGSISENEINNCLKNHMTINYLNKNGQVLFAGMGAPPISIGDKGKVSITIPKNEHVNVFSTRADRGTPMGEEEYQNELKSIPLEHSSYAADVSIANGAEAAALINSELADELYIDRTIDWGSAGNTSFKIGTKILDHFVPGMGTIVSKVKKYAVDIPKKVVSKTGEYVDIIEENSSGYVTQSEKVGYSWFIENFDLKCVAVDGSYTLYPSRNTENIVNNMLEWMERNHNDIYHEIIPNACFEDGTTDAEWFINNADPNIIYNNLQGSGILEELKSAGII